MEELRENLPDIESIEEVVLRLTNDIRVHLGMSAAAPPDPERPRPTLREASGNGVPDATAGDTTPVAAAASTVATPATTWPTIATTAAATSSPPAARSEKSQSVPAPSSQLQGPPAKSAQSQNSSTAATPDAIRPTIPTTAAATPLPAEADNPQRSPTKAFHPQQGPPGSAPAKASQPQKQSTTSSHSASQSPQSLRQSPQPLRNVTAADLRHLAPSAYPPAKTALPMSPGRRHVAERASQRGAAAARQPLQRSVTSPAGAIRGNQEQSATSPAGADLSSGGRPTAKAPSPTNAMAAQMSALACAEAEAEAADRSSRDESLSLLRSRSSGEKIRRSRTFDQSPREPSSKKLSEMDPMLREQKLAQMRSQGSLAKEMASMDRCARCRRECFDSPFFVVLPSSHR